MLIIKILKSITIKEILKNSTKTSFVENNSAQSINFQNSTTWLTMKFLF